MTNEVEKLILSSNREYDNINFKEQISFLLYKEIWGFILRILKQQPQYIKISIKIKKYLENEYAILKFDDIKYSIKKDDNSYFDTYENSIYNNLIIKSIFNLKDLYKLLENDNFIYNLSIFKDYIILNVMIDKDKVNNIIDTIMLKNGKVKKLSREV